MSCCLWDPDIHYHVHNSPLLVIILKQLNQPTPLPSTSLRLILIYLSHLCLPSNCMPWDFYLIKSSSFLLSSMSYQAHPLWFNCLKVDGKEYKSCSSSLCYLLPLKSKFFLSTLFSSNLSLCSSSRVTMTFTTDTKQTDRLTIMYILISRILVRK